MKKPILATNIDGLLIKHEAFIEPHKAWFDRAIKLTRDKSLEQWKGRKDYFKGVDIAMEKILPDKSPDERTSQARRWYQEDVVKYIREHPESVYTNAAQALKRLKPRFTLALVTTNAQEYIGQILEAARLNDIYYIIFAIPETEKPDKASLFDRFTKEHGNPKFYIAARSKESFEECLKLGSFCIYASWDDFDQELASLAKKTIKSPSELESVLA